MKAFTEDEIDYLQSGLLGRLATVGRDGMPHVAPVGFSYNAELGTIDVGGRDITNTKKFRDVARSGRAALVVDDVRPPWKPRGIEVRGRAEAVDGTPPLIRIHPERIVSWGMSDLSGRSGRHVG
jgi:pyridoxamine 5'-phosphate oxidase family protein